MRLLLLALAVILSCSTAWADDRADAKREFAAGQAADHDQDWPNALEHYLRANQILEHPNTVNNIAIDYEHLQKWREAATWYRKYLELAPDAADAPKVRQKIADLAVHIGPVNIHSNPPGARVLVDGEPVGSTPVTLQLKGGSHRITIEQNGKHVDKVVHSEYGEPLDVPMSAAGEEGTLLVFGAPEGATVYVDDQPAGTLPAQVSLPPGPHQVRVQAVGYDELSTEATISPANVTRLPVQLQQPGQNGNGTPRKITVAYLLGASGGINAEDASPDVTVDFGVRVARYDLVSQIGKANGGLYINVAVRADLTSGAFAPFIGASYFFVSDTSSDSTGTSGSGLSALGGLRYNAGMITLRATAGVGYFAASSSGSSSSGTKLAIPVTVSLELAYGGR